MTTPPSSAPGCIFCKIAAGEIPCFKIFEDDALLAFLDVNPTVTGHVLIIPKAHFANVMEAPPEIMAALGRQLPALARAVLAATRTVACHVLLNNGQQAMQTISHLHYHIMPRKTGDGFGIPWKTTPLEKVAGEALRAAIQQNLTPIPPQ